MPCSDVTEMIRIVLDPQDRITSYELNKRTCGRAVGEASLLEPWAAGLAAEEVLEAPPEQVLAGFAIDGEAEEYLHLKHLAAMRMALRVLTGRDPGGADDACATASMACGPEGTEFVGRLRVEVLTEEIKSCGRCGTGCGTRAKKNGGRESAAAT